MKQIKSEYVRAELAKLGVSPKPKRAPVVRRKQQAEPLRRPGYYGAMMHVRNMRRGDFRSATWFDVRDAYLAGYEMGFLAGATSNG